MSMMSEFKEFAVKGNAVELAIGLIIATEFGKIINSLVADVIMPPIGLLLGNVDFKNIFLIVAFVVFMLVRYMNKAKGLQAVVPKP